MSFDTQSTLQYHIMSILNTQIQATVAFQSTNVILT